MPAEFDSWFCQGPRISLSEAPLGARGDALKAAPLPPPLRGGRTGGCILSTSDGLKPPLVFLNSSYLLGTTHVKVQHICSSSSDL